MQNNLFLPENKCDNLVINNDLINYLIETHEHCVFFAVGENLEISAVNQAAAVLLKTDKSNIINKNLFDVLPVSIDKDIKNAIKNCKENEKKIDVNITQNKETYNLTASAFSGGILIALKKIAQQAGSVDENNFKLLFENMSSGFVYLKVNFNEKGEAENNQVVDVNSMFEVFFGVDRSEILGKSLDEILPQIDQRVFQAISLTAKTGRSRSCNFDYKPSRKYLQACTYSPRQHHTAVIFNDLKTEIELRNDLKIKNKISKAFAMGHSTDLYNVVLDHVLELSGSPNGYIGSFSDDGDIICFAERDKALRIQKDKFGDDRIGIDAVTFKAIKSREQETAPGILGHKIVLATLVKTEDGKIIGVIGVADSPRGYDFRTQNAVQELADYIAPLMLSEIKDRNYKRDLIVAKERAESGERLKSNFLKNISHEIRTPANIIMGNCELLLRRAANIMESEHRQLFDEIYNHTQKLVYIVDAIKNLAKIENKQVSVFKMRTNLNSLLEGIRKKWEFEAQSKKLYIRSDYGLQGEDAIVMIDNQKVKSIIEALVTNGIRFTHEGGIVIKYVLEGDNLVFSVIDTGEGIQIERQKSIFEPFEQNNTDKDFMRRTSGGVGLGLTISKGFADVMGGEIWLESQPQTGSTFYLKIKYEKYQS